MRCLVLKLRFITRYGRLLYVVIRVETVYELMARDFFYQIVVNIAHLNLSNVYFSGSDLSST